MSYDEEIIKKLSQRIGEAIPPVDKMKWDSVAYQCTASRQVIGLNLTRCQLSTWPPEIFQLRQLQALDLSGNELTSIPAEIINFQRLKYLYLDANKISYLPPEIGQLPLLQLWLQENQLTHLPKEIGQLRQLETLFLERNKIKVLPSELGQLDQLQALDLRNNQLADLPEEICQLSRLAGKNQRAEPKLRLDGNPFTNPVLEIAKQGFEAVCNYLKAMKTIKQLSQRMSKALPLLAEMEIEKNYTFGYQLDMSGQVIGLGLSNCQLKCLPPEIFQLQQLQQLDLSRNQITTLPAEIGQLHKLQLIDIHNNKLTALPPEICQLAGENADGYPRLRLDENPLTDPPLEIAEEGFEAVCNYLKAMKTIKQLSQRIGKAIPQVAKIEWNTVGYQLDSNGQVIGLGLYRCELEELPPEIGQLRQLQKLDLTYNQLMALPPEIGQLRQLQALYLRGNELTALPPEIFQLRQLQVLDLYENQLTALPPEIGQLQQLQALELGWNELTALPPEIGQLRQLQDLDLHYNQLTALPPEIGQLRQLQVLNLEGNPHLDAVNQLTALPPEIGQLQQLRELDLSNNQFSELPAEIGQLQQLQQLNLGSNAFTDLASEIIKLQQLQQLQQLDLHNNQLSQLPAEIGQLRQLQVLNLRENQLTELPPEIGQLRQLQELDLWENQLTVLPPQIGQLQQLRVLDLETNKLTALPPEIGQLRQLQALGLGGNELTALPPEIGQLQQLQKLVLGSNLFTDLAAELIRLQQLPRLRELGLSGSELTTLPTEIFSLRQLQELDLTYNQLTALPPEIGQLRQLQVLHLYENLLTALPPEIGQLRQLQVLHLYENLLTALPPEIGQLRQLQELYLWKNQLTTLLPEICQLTQLAGKNRFGVPRLRLDKNPLTDPPLEIAVEGYEAVCAYFAAKNAKKPLRECKVILLGDGASGKTSLMKRLQNQPFNPNESQTHGINIAPWPVTLADGDATLYLWDFGGQQIMHATHQWFLSKRSLYLLLVDSRREMQVEYWLEHLKTFANQAPVIIVINKIDEHAHFDLPRATLQAKYPNIVDFVKISCKSGVGLQELRQAMATALPQVELLNTLFPQQWLKVKQALEQQAQAKNYTPYDDYFQLCQAHDITEENEQKVLIQFLHDLGVVIHFPEPWLRETNVINPRWLTEGIYQIITHAELVQDGRLFTKDLAKILDRQVYPSHKHDYLLALMRKFALCYSLSSEIHLIPDLFPINRPSFTFNKNNALHFSLSYDFLPPALVNRFLLRFFKDVKHYWRGGAVWQDLRYQVAVMVEADFKQARFDWYLLGESRFDYLSIMRFVLADIERRFSQLTVKENIGLPDDPERLVSYQHVLKLKSRGQEIYLPEHSEQEYRIDEILGMSTKTISDNAVMQRLDKILEILNASGIADEKTTLAHLNDVVQMQPNIFGIGVNLNALLKKWQERRR